MTNNLFCGIRNSIYNHDNNALITIHLKSGKYITAHIKNLEYKGDYVVIDTDNEDISYVPIESIEFIQN